MINHNEPRNRLMRDKQYFDRKELIEKLHNFGKTLSPSNPSKFAQLMTNFVMSQHVFSCFDPYSTSWLTLVLVCKDWFNVIVMEEDGLLWREHYRQLLNSMTCYYSSLSPFNYMNYKHLFFEQITHDTHHRLETDQSFKELKSNTWKENYDHVLAQCLGLNKTETDFESKTTRIVAKLFLDNNKGTSNNGQLATVREFYVHKFIFDAMLPIIEVPSSTNGEKEFEASFNVVEKKLFFMETSRPVNWIYLTPKIENGLLFRVKCLSKNDGSLHYRYYAAFNGEDRNLNFILDVEPSSFDIGQANSEITTNSLEKERHSFMRLGNVESIAVDSLNTFTQKLSSLLSKRFGNIYLAELFCKYWYCIEHWKDPIESQIADDNPFWFLDVFSRHAKYKLEEKVIRELAVMSVGILGTVRKLDIIPKSFIIEDIKKKKNQNVSLEVKELSTFNAKLESVCGKRADVCWNNRGITIKNNEENHSSTFTGLLCTNTEVVHFEIQTPNTENPSQLFSLTILN